MRLLTLNLRHGGGTRMDALCADVLGHAADVLVLTEVRHNAVLAKLRAALSAAGYAGQVLGLAPPRVNTVLVAARGPLRARPWRGDPARVLDVSVDGLRLAAVHLPNQAAKRPHWAELLRRGRIWARRPACFVGDFNTGLPAADGPDYPFTCEEEMRALLGMGWQDAWRHLHPEAREYTWYSHRGNGFRLDHAFLSPALAPHLRGAHFDHGPRERGHTDHSALVVDLEPQGE